MNDVSAENNVNYMLAWSSHLIYSKLQPNKCINLYSVIPTLIKCSRMITYPHPAPIWLSISKSRLCNISVWLLITRDNDEEAHQISISVSRDWCKEMRVWFIHSLLLSLCEEGIWRWWWRWYKTRIVTRNNTFPGVVLSSSSPPSSISSCQTNERCYLQISFHSLDSRGEDNLCKLLIAK